MQLVVSDKTTVATTSKQQRLFPIVRKGLDLPEENHVIDAIISIDCATLKIRDAFSQKRRLVNPRRPVDPDKFLIGRLVELVGERLLRNAKYVDGKVAGILKHAQPR